MEKIKVIMFHNLKLFLQSPISIVMLMAPVIIIAASSLLFKDLGSMPIAAVGFYSEDVSEVTELLIEELEERQLEVVVAASEMELKELVSEKKVQGTVDIDAEDMIASLYNEEAAIRVAQIGESQKAQFAQEQVATILKQYDMRAKQAYGDSVAFLEISKAAEAEGLHVVVETEYKDIEQMLTSLGFFILIFLFTCSKSLQPMIKEKESYVYSRIKTGAIKEHEYLLGHILGSLIVLTIQSIILCVGIAVMGVDFQINSVQLLVICSVLAMVGVSISLLVYQFTKKTNDYYVISTFVITLLCMIGGGMFPVEYLPSGLQQINTLSPISWVVMAYKNMLMQGEWWQVAKCLSMAILISLVILLFILYKQVNRRSRTD